MANGGWRKEKLHRQESWSKSNGKTLAREETRQEHLQEAPHDHHRLSSVTLGAVLGVLGLIMNLF